jgi:ribosome-associated translation inhibitor RaiA
MIKVTFKNLSKSELVVAAIERRIKMIGDKFPNLKASDVFVSAEMKNSPLQAGPDLYTISLEIRRGIYQGVRVGRSAQNLYRAMNDLFELLLFKLNRVSDRARVRERTSARRIHRLVSTVC